MHRTIQFPLLAGKYFEVTGGPYFEHESRFVGLKMAAEIRKACTIDVPTRDFCVPRLQDATRGLKSAINCILAGKPLYVGCYGGIGRTGLMLALIAKAFGEKDPVAYVRQNYVEHAVETAEQQSYVADFKVPLSVRTRIRWARLSAFFKKDGCLTNY